MKLFVYGELCKPPVLLEVLGRVPPARPALLPGFRRSLNPETGFYRAERRAGAVIAGLALDEVDGDDLEVLDRYENVDGGEYARFEVEIRSLGVEASEPAFVYAARASGSETVRRAAR